MAVVRLAADAQEDFDALPSTMKGRVLAVFGRLQRWPGVSGAKPLRGRWSGHYRVRTGDWRVIFRFVSPEVIVVRIKHRSEVYEE
jgi:mRNA-degrading endonuclease RelE of RelBE toxin-antitoxin system